MLRFGTVAALGALLPPAARAATRAPDEDFVSLSPSTPDRNTVQPTADVPALRLIPQAGGIDNDTLQSFLPDGTTLVTRLRATGDLSFKVSAVDEPERGVEFLADDPVGGRWSLHARDVPSHGDADNLLLLEWTEPGGPRFINELNSNFNSGVENLIEWNLDCYNPSGTLTRLAHMTWKRDTFESGWAFQATDPNRGFRIETSLFVRNFQFFPSGTQQMNFKQVGSEMQIGGDLGGNEPKRIVLGPTALASGPQQLWGAIKIADDGVFTIPAFSIARVGSVGGKLDGIIQVFPATDDVPIRARLGGAGTAKALILEEPDGSDILSVSSAGILSLASGGDLRAAGNLFVSSNHASGKVTIRNIKSADSWTFEAGGKLTLPDGGSIVVGSSVGTKIGTTKTQKLSVFGQTPVVQQKGGPGVAGQVYGINEQGMIQRMYDALRAYGWLS